MRILGVDPGTAETGYGLIERFGGGWKALAYGRIQTSPSEPLEARLLAIHRELSELMARHQPTEAAVEGIFFNRNVRSALAVGQARGAALLAIAQFGLRVAEYTPSAVKQAVTGHGGAAKSQVQFMVQRLLGLSGPPKPDDVADALAVAICHGHTCETDSKAAGPQAGLR